jgi:hypothetical protein
MSLALGLGKVQARRLPERFCETTPPSANLKAPRYSRHA